MTPRVLVTGGAGFIGSHVVAALLARGERVQVVDDLSTGARRNLGDGVPLSVVDISDEGALRRELGGERFDGVVHCAARTKVVQSIEQPDLYRRVIVEGTRRVVSIARAAGATALVNVSTGGALYGETPRCATEDTPIAPDSPYGVYKAETEAVVAGAGIRAPTLRLANVYGPRQRGDLEGGVVAIFFARWRQGEPLTVYGDGTAERDYVYVGDVVDAILAALDREVVGAYNVGTGIATSVNELIAELAALLGPPPGVQHAPPRPGELQRSCLDPSKAARDGIWRPRARLSEGLRLTLEAEGR
jgi:UDP-glucose 4-epimerase